jgi:hypothetical protein
MSDVKRFAHNPDFKLSPTALACFMESPKAFYWRYIANLEPATQSVAEYDHDKLCGVLWAEFVDRFYKGAPEDPNYVKLMKDWDEQTQGWVPPPFKDKLSKAMEQWAITYYKEYNPKDGVRNGSEKHVENERFHGYLDGLSHDEQTIHEVKSTSRAKNVSEQILKFQLSWQVKIYAVLTKATGVIIETAYKDPPYAIYRAPRYEFTPQEVADWESGFNKLADYIYSLGNDPANYVCYADSCSLITKNFCGICEYQPLCLGISGAEIAFKPRQRREASK